MAFSSSALLTILSPSASTWSNRADKPGKFSASKRSSLPSLLASAFVKAAVISLADIGFSAGAGDAAAGAVVDGDMPPAAGAVDWAHTAPVAKKARVAPVIKVRDLKVIKRTPVQVEGASIAPQQRVIAKRYCLLLL
jgi:hypothetical protein